MKKEIAKKQLEKTIKEEFKMARDWLRAGTGRRFKMMIDTSDASIWSDCFLSDNEYEVYSKSSIHRIFSEDYTVPEREAGYLSEAIQMLKEVGWEII